MGFNSGFKGLRLPLHFHSDNAGRPVLPIMRVEHCTRVRVCVCVCVCVRARVDSISQSGNGIYTGLRVQK